MQLLSLLYSSSAAVEDQANLESLAPRLFPFFRHTLTSVRLASVTCYCLLLEKSPEKASWLIPEVLHPAVLLTFQNLTVEADPTVSKKSKASYIRHLEELAYSLSYYERADSRFC